MLKTRSKKRVKNKTHKKRKITFDRKKKFIHSIIYYWKKFGNVVEDKTTIHEHDYYLSFGKNANYYNHIHLVLHHFYYTHDTYNNIIYLMKKLGKDKQTIIHSKPIHIDIFSDPKIVVNNMKKNYNNFISKLK